MYSHHHYVPQRSFWQQAGTKLVEESSQSIQNAGFSIPESCAVIFEVSVLNADLASSAAGLSESGFQFDWVFYLQNTYVLSCLWEKNIRSHHILPPYCGELGLKLH